MSRAREFAPGHRSVDTSARPGRRANHPVLALQQAVGNRAFGQLLARAPSQKPTIRIGKLAIVVDGGNIAAWAAAAKEVPEALEVTSEKGRHSAELERLSKERTRIKSLTLTVAAANKSSGQALDMGTLVIEFTNARIKYTVDGKAESWQVVDFDRVNRTKTTRTVGT
jgi:hypothetical protein